MESGEVTIEIYRGNELRSVKAGKGNFWVKFGTDKKKFQTSKISDALGFPSWNTTAAVPVSASAKNIKMKVMDGDKCVGQLTIPLSQIARSKIDANAQQPPLQPHRQCAHPTGSVSFLCYYTRFIEAPGGGNGSTANLAVDAGEQRLSGFGLMPPSMTGSVQSLSKRSSGGVLGKLKQAMTPSGKLGSLRRKDDTPDNLRASAKTLSFSTYDMRSMKSPQVQPGKRRSQASNGASNHSDDDESLDEWRLDLEGASAAQNTTASTPGSTSGPANTSAGRTGSSFTSELPPKPPASGSGLRVSNSMKDVNARPKPVVALPVPAVVRQSPADEEPEGGNFRRLDSFRMPKDIERIAASGDKFQSMPHVRRRQPAIVGDGQSAADDSDTSSRPSAQSLAERMRINRGLQQTGSQQSDSPSSVMTPPRSESTLLSSSMKEDRSTPPSNASSRQNSLSREAMRHPQVMSCEPAEGTIQGNTAITIRGVNLGSSETDIVAVYVCGANCRNSLVYQSSNEIRCVTKSWRECTGFVVVETKTGGRSNSVVQFAYKDYSKVQVFPSPSPSPLLSRREPARSSGMSKASNDSLMSGGHSMPALNTFVSQNTNSSTPLQSQTQPQATPASAGTASAAAPTPTVSVTAPATATPANTTGQKVASDVVLEMASENTRLRQRLTETEQTNRKLQSENVALKSYIETLLERIMIKCPEVLCIADGDTNDKGKKRST